MNRKSIGILLMIISIVAAISGSLAGYKVLYHSELTGYIIISLLVSVILLIAGCIYLRDSVSFISVFVRVILVIISSIFLFFFLPEVNFITLLLVVIWSLMIIQGYNYKPANRKSTGLLLLICGVFSILLYFMIHTFFSPSFESMGLILTLISLGLFLVGIFYLIFLPREIRFHESPRVLYSFMVLTVIGGLVLLLYNGLGNWMNFLGVIGWVLFLLFMEWFLYKIRHLRLVIYWLFLIIFPAAVSLVYAFIRDMSKNNPMNWYSYFILFIILMFLLGFFGILSPIGLMGLFRIPGYRDFKKYLFLKSIPKSLTASEVKKNPAKGFTLIELLIVIAIVAILAGGILQLFGFTILGAKHMELKNQAIRVAGNEMERLRNVSLSKYSMGESYAFTEEGKKEIQSLPGGEGEIRIKPYKKTGLKEIEVVIQWNEGTREKNVQLRTLRGDEIP